ncbi:uncharacterized protein [Macrobrachium rosenbergii]|uniref:uncharacterized protein n=1 Tax=Macrobrachium rosenbergii TaxID=79674 RepID=UPI0034D4CB64
MATMKSSGDNSPGDIADKQTIPPQIHTDRCHLESLRPLRSRDLGLGKPWSHQSNDEGMNHTSGTLKKFPLQKPLGLHQSWDAVLSQKQVFELQCSWSKGCRQLETGLQPSVGRETEEVPAVPNQVFEFTVGGQAALTGCRRTPRPGGNSACSAKPARWVATRSTGMRSSRSQSAAGHIHVDVIGPLPPSGGSRYLQMVVDRLTRWPEATPMQEATASACAEALLSSWVSHFSVPDHITTELWSALAQLLGTTHHTTTAYNPAANGLVERFHRSLKASLMARCTAEDWKHQLPWVLLGLRTTPRADSTPSAAEKTYGEPLLVPGELVTEDRHIPSLQRLRDVAGKFAPCKRTYTERSATFTPPELSSATHVFVRVDAVRHEELD